MYYCVWGVLLCLYRVYWEAAAVGRLGRQTEFWYLTEPAAVQPLQSRELAKLPNDSVEQRAE